MFLNPDSFIFHRLASCIDSLLTETVACYCNRFYTNKPELAASRIKSIRTVRNRNVHLCVGISKQQRQRQVKFTWCQRSVIFDNVDGGVEGEFGAVEVVLTPLL